MKRIREQGMNPRKEMQSPTKRRRTVSDDFDIGDYNISATPKFYPNVSHLSAVSQSSGEGGFSFHERPSANTTANKSVYSVDSTDKSVYSVDSTDKSVYSVNSTDKSHFSLSSTSTGRGAKQHNVSSFGSFSPGDFMKSPELAGILASFVTPPPTVNNSSRKLNDVSFDPSISPEGSSTPMLGPKDIAGFEPNLGMSPEMAELFMHRIASQMSRHIIGSTPNDSMYQLNWMFQRRAEILAGDARKAENKDWS